MPQELNNLKWFKKNIDLQLEDIELEKEGHTTILYFDTADAQAAIMGLRAFYDSEEFNPHRFKEKKTLVNTLTAVGFLGKFSLLPPHLSEFYRKAENNFSLEITTDWKAEIKKFLDDLRLLENENVFETLDGRSEQELSEIFSKQAGNGVHWFNAIYSLTPWHRKLGVWLRTDLLEIDEEKFDYEKTVKSEHFGYLKQIFDRYRAATINNFVDAAALANLIETVEKFNRGETHQVPRFFIPRGANNLWYKILKELNWYDKFVCDSDFSFGSSSWVFRGEDYYLYKIAFRLRFAAEENDTLTEESREEILDKEFKTLSNWRERVVEAISSLPTEPSKLYNQTLNKIHINQDLENLINSLQHYSVLDQDWFKNAAAKEFLNILKESKASNAIIEEQRKIYEDRNFKEFISNELQGKRNELSEELRDFRLVSQMYDALYNSIGNLKKRIGSYTILETDEFFPFLGLLRYGFPPDTRQSIIEILNKLRSGEDNNIRNGCAEAIRCYIDGRKNPIERANDLMIATGILLAVNNNTLLKKLFNDIKQNIPHFSLKIAYAEFLFRKEPRHDRERRKALQLLDELERMWHDPETELALKTNLAVGLAYLYYWAWRGAGGVAVWELLLKNADLKPDIFFDFYINKAIFYADQGYRRLQNHHPEHQAYALNQYLFCSIEGGNGELFNDLEEKKNELQNYRENIKVWQFRFDDTLARYYFRKAFSPEQLDNKKDLIKIAKEYEDKAKSRSDGDVEIDIFYDKITQAWENIY